MAKIQIECEPAMAPHVQKVLSGEYAIDHLLPDGVEVKIHSILDIGANVGAFSIWAHGKYPDASILAFEPHPSNHALWCKNLGVHDEITCANLAVGKEHGARQLLPGLNNCGEHSLHDCGEQDMNAEPIEVSCITSRSLESAHWVKIDAEGSEVEILEGLDLSETKVVTLEFHGKERRERCKDLLMPHFHLVEQGQRADGERGIQKWLRKNIPRRPVVYMALPRYGGGEPLFEDALFRAITTPGAVQIVKQDLIGDSLVPRARNNLVQTFLRSQASHLLFIDTDLIFNRAQIDRLAAHNAEVVGGLYPKKQDEIAWVCNTHPEHPEVGADGLHRVLYIGTGFLMIRRDVIERMVEAYPESVYCRDVGEEARSGFDAFPVGVYHYTEEQQKRFKQPAARYLSEDWYFCQRCIDMDIPVYADTRVVLRHVGKKVYHPDAVFLATQKPAEQLETAA